MLRLTTSREAPQPRSQRGQGLVEFAFSLLFLIILLAGIVDLGRALLVYIELCDAAQEGASFGAYDAEVGEPVAQVMERIEARTRQSADAPLDLQTDPDIQVEVRFHDVTGTGIWCAENRVEVELTYEFNIAMPFLGAFLGTQTFPIRSTVSDTIIRPPCPSYPY